MNRLIKDGDIINNLKVLQCIKRENKCKARSFICECLLCGKKITINRTDKLKKTQDCGCKTKSKKDINETDIIGFRFGKLLVIKCLGVKEEIYNRKMNFWLCKCDCGKEVEVARSSLRKNGGVKSCGQCPKYSNGEIPQIFYHNNIERSAKARNLECTITPEYIWDIYLKQNRKCSLTGRIIFLDYDGKKCTASLDRIDSSKGYIEGNVQWVHRDVNRIKNNYNQDYFISLCRDIYKNNEGKIIPIDRPSWFDYFLGIALVVAQRSIDAQTKCGCVLVDEYNHILATGYNSFPKGMPDDILPNTRPDKYPLVIHAEESALLNLSTTIYDKNVTAFITMQPCLECLKRMIQANIKRIVVIDREVSNKTLENNDYWHLFLHHSKIEYIKIKPKLDWIYNI